MMLVDENCLANCSGQMETTNQTTRHLSEDRPWAMHFVEPRCSDYEGCVYSTKEVVSVIEEFEVATRSIYVRTRGQMDGYGKEFDPNRSFKVRWEDYINLRPHIPYDGIPFVINGSRLLECHLGRGKRRNRTNNFSQHANCSADRKRKLKRETKKLQCSAIIKVRHIVKFPEYKLHRDQSESKRNELTRMLRQDFMSSTNVFKEHRYYILLPQNHNHLIGEDLSYENEPLDKRLSQHIKRKVFQGSQYSTNEMKDSVERYLRRLYPGSALPSKSMKRFWPDGKTIRNHMSLAKSRIKKQDFSKKTSSDTESAVSDDGHEPEPDIQISHEDIVEAQREDLERKLEELKRLSFSCNEIGILTGCLAAIDKTLRFVETGGESSESILIDKHLPEKEGIAKYRKIALMKKKESIQIMRNKELPYQTVLPSTTAPPQYFIENNETYLNLG